MRKFGIFAYHVLLLFCLLGILFIPFSFKYLHVQSKITKFLFEDLIVFIASNLKNIHIANPEISSDSTTLYLLLVVLFFVSIILVITFSFFNFWKKYQALIVQTIQLIMIFYLSVIMLKYGIDKIFKAQFYLPEPNTLYTPLGMLDKDLLYWSTMGTSHIYNIFMGFSEVIPAILLLFSRTRIFGLFILSGVLINVVFINLGFDISVKLYSLFLLFLCFILLAPSINTFFHFFILNKSATLTPITGKTVIASKINRIALKGTIIIFFFAESLFPYIQKGQYNDDNIPRNYLHGAYEILEVEKGYENSLNINLKRVFIHRYNYFIFQYEDDTMEDFYLEIDPTKSQFILTNYEGELITLQYKYSQISKILELKFVDSGMTIYSKSLPWRDLPLLQPLFHWTVDEIH